jgi:hypothetical protein
VSDHRLCSAAIMTKVTHKRHPSDGIAAVPSKKLKVGSPSRRSSRAGKGRGGATEQLRKAGEAIAPNARRKSDPFAEAGEAPNPMAPESQHRTERVSDIQLSHSDPTFNVSTV